MDNYYLVFLWISSHTLLVANCCERNVEATGVEDYCWTKNVEVLDRLHYTGKSFLNFAKKKLGMEVEESEEPQKCEYYNCIFRELKMLNANDYPCHEKMTKWIKNNVVYNHAIILLSQIDYCSDRLANSTISETYFTGDLLEEIVLNTPEATKIPEPQSKCDIVAEYTKCIALVEKNEKCPVFQYP